MAQYVMILRGATSLLGALEGVDPRNDVAPLKIITYCAIKTTGTLIVITILCAFAFHVSKKYQYGPLIFCKIQMCIKNAEFYADIEFFEKVAKMRKKL
jgi:hypothetical protein